MPEQPPPTLGAPPAELWRASMTGEGLVVASRDWPARSASRVP